MSDEFTAYYHDLLYGTYDCVDRIVINAYFPLGHNPAGFRHWWRQLHGSDDNLDNAHLMRMAGRFSRRLHAYAKAHHIPVIHCESGERKHEIAQEYLAKNSTTRGLFLLLVSRAPAPVWEVTRGANGYLNIVRKKSLPYVNHYFFHFLDPEWGHVTIKMCGHPPFPAQILLNGHEYVACQAQRAGVSFAKEGNCFTEISDANLLATIADTLRVSGAIGRLSQLCERWIYSACLCFALRTEEQERSGFRYAFSVYQVEYSRNLLFRRGAQMEQLFQGMIDRTRAGLDVARIKTILGVKKRPYRHKGSNKDPRMEVAVEKPAYDLTVFKIHFGKLTLKGYTKGERVLRFEAVAHNTRDLRCGRVLSRFPDIIHCLHGLLDRFLNALHGIDAPFIQASAWEQLPAPSQVGKSRVGGVDINKPRIRAVFGAVIALAASPIGFTASELASKVRSLTGQTEQEYRSTRAAYDIKKLRGKSLLVKVGKSRRYEPLADGLRAMAATLVLTDKVIKPVLAGAAQVRRGPKPRNVSSIDSHYEALRVEMKRLLADLGIAA